MLAQLQMLMKLMTVRAGRALDQSSQLEEETTQGGVNIITLFFSATNNAQKY
jgi:hypothetical protein